MRKEYVGDDEMIERDIVRSTEVMYCHHICRKDAYDAKRFKIANSQGGYLAEYLSYDALDDEKNRLARTYIVRSKATDEMIAYFSLRSGFVSANEKGLFWNKGFDTVPGVEISNFAINGEFRKNHPESRGVGDYIFHTLIIPLIEVVSKLVGTSVIYIFALPRERLVKHYEEVFGFSRLSKMQEMSMHKRIRPRYDKGCIFMYRKI